MNVFAAIVSGVVGALALSLVMALAPMLGMPRMDTVGMLSTMFGKANKMLGWIMHLMMGAVFALVYGFLWSQGIGAPAVGSAVLFGAVHWFVVGIGMVMVPMMHAGIKSGEVAAPGAWMTNQGGMMAFVGGLLGHIFFALVVGLVYNLF
jgi:hypothetical protein